MWELDHKESQALKNKCFWTVVLEKTFESPLDCKEIDPVNPKGNQLWIFIQRTDAKAKALILGHLMRRTDSFEKTLMLGKIEGRRRRGWQRMRWLVVITNSMDRVWARSSNWWWTGKPGMLQFTGSQRIGHDWATELNWTNILLSYPKLRKAALPKAMFHFQGSLCSGTGKYRDTKAWLAALPRLGISLNDLPHFQIFSRIGWMHWCESYFSLCLFPCSFQVSFQGAHPSGCISQSRLLRESITGENV